MAKRHQLTRERAKDLRKTMTPPERALWEIVRGKRLGGVKFVRQAVRAPYIPDFAARSERLIVELDGDTHGSDEAQACDADRTAALEAQGWQIVRFTNGEVMTNPDGVARAILLALGKDFEGRPPLPGADAPTLSP
jgi:very-short-patch-repair endonuclease